MFTSRKLMLLTRPVAGCLLFLATQAMLPATPASLNQICLNDRTTASVFQPVQDGPAIEAWHPTPYVQSHQPNRQSLTSTRLQRGILNVSGEELVKRMELDNRHSRNWIARSELASFLGNVAKTGSTPFHRRQRM